MTNVIRIGMALLFGAAACAASAAPSYTVTKLGVWDTAGLTLFGLSNNGVGAGTSYSGPWSELVATPLLVGPTTVEPLDPTGTLHAAALEINDAGMVAGHMQTYDRNGYEVTHAAVFSGGTATTLRPAGEVSGTANAINNAGQAAGYMHFSDGNDRAFMYSASTGLVQLPGLAANRDAQAWGMNDAGTVVGRAQDAFGQWHAFQYANGVSTDLGVSGYVSFANAINNDGVAVGSTSIAGDFYTIHAAIFSDGQVIDIGTLGGSNSRATDINAAGDIVGASYRADNSWGYFIYQDGTMTDLDTVITPGYSMQLADAINDRGEILGLASDGQRSYMVLLSPVAEPPAYALLLAGLGAPAALRRRGRRTAARAPLLNA